MQFKVPILGNEWIKLFHLGDCLEGYEEQLPISARLSQWKMLSSICHPGFSKRYPCLSVQSLVDLLLQLVHGLMQFGQFSAPLDGFWLVDNQVPTSFAPIPGQG